MVFGADSFWHNSLCREELAANFRSGFIGKASETPIWWSRRKPVVPHPGKSPCGFVDGWRLFLENSTARGCFLTAGFVWFFGSFLPPGFVGVGVPLIWCLARVVCGVPGWG